MDHRSFLYAVTLHGGVALGLWLVLHISPQPKMPLHRVLPVKLVPIGAITAAPRPPQKIVKKKVVKPATQSKPKAKLKAPAAGKVIPLKQKATSSIPKIDKPQKNPSLAKAAPKKGSAPKTPQKDAFETLLEEVSTLKDTKKTKTNGFESDLISHKLSVSELDALRQQIQQCWVVPPSMLSEKHLLVEVGVHLNAEGVVQSLKVLNQAPPLKGPIFQVAVDSIRQALKAPACTPLRMPQGKYDQWKYCVFRFQPRGVL